MVSVFWVYIGGGGVRGGGVAEAAAGCVLRHHGVAEGNFGEGGEGVLLECVPVCTRLWATGTRPLSLLLDGLSGHRWNPMVAAVSATSHLSSQLAEHLLTIFITGLHYNQSGSQASACRA
jgi:hypothetical protein